MVSDTPKRHRFILHLKIIINNETTSFYLLQRRNDVISATFKFQKEELVPRFQISICRGVGGGGGGGGGGFHLVQASSGSGSGDGDDGRRLSFWSEVGEDD